MRSVAPFPLASLARVSRAETLGLQRLARSLDASPLSAAAADLAPILGGTLEVEPAALERWPAGAMERREDVPLVAVAIGDALAGPGARLALELDPDLAGLLVDRALGAQDGEPRLSAGPASDGERGVLAYIAARALAPAGGRLRVVAVLTSTASLRAAVGDGALCAWPARLSIGTVTGWARLWIPDSWSPPLARRDAASWTRALEIDLSIVAGSATLPAAELASLEPGDVLVPDTLWVTLAPLRGAVSLVAVHGGPAFRASLRADGALVLGEAAPAAPAPARPHRATVAADMQRPEALGDVVNEVPVELRVEIGRVIVRVADLAALRPGEILTTGSPVGARVVLRAADEIVATGELCDVEGELGVRILELARRG